MAPVRLVDRLTAPPYGSARATERVSQLPWLRVFVAIFHELLDRKSSALYRAVHRTELDDDDLEAPSEPQSMSESADTIAAPPRTPSIWEDLVDIYFSPREVFERRRLGGFGVPLLMLTLVLAVLAVPTQMSIADLMRDTIRESMANAGQGEPSSEQLANMGQITMLMGVVGTLVTVPVGALLSGLVLAGLGVLAGVKLPVRAAVLVAVWAGFPRVWAMVVTMLEASLLNPARLTDLSLGPARLLGPDASPLLAGVLSRLDVFTVWAMVLVAIGWMVVGGASRGKAVAIAAGLWIVGCVPPVLGALFAGPPGG